MSTPAPDATPEEIYDYLRNQVLTAAPEGLGIARTKEFGNAWGILMDVISLEGAVSLVVVADNTVSVYLQKGGGIIGAGAHVNVRKAAFLYLQEAAQSQDSMSPAVSFDLPQEGSIKFYILTYAGILTAEVTEQDLATGEHPLYDLFVSANKVLTEIRKVDEKRKNLIQ